MSMPRPSEWVSFILPTGPNAGKARPLLVVAFNAPKQMVAGWVFPVPSQDGDDWQGPTWIEAARAQHPPRGLGTWFSPSPDDHGPSGVAFDDGDRVP